MYQRCRDQYCRDEWHCEYKMGLVVGEALFLPPDLDLITDRSQYDAHCREYACGERMYNASRVSVINRTTAAEADILAMVERAVMKPAANEAREIKRSGNVRGL